MLRCLPRCVSTADILRESSAPCKTPTTAGRSACSASHPSSVAGFNTNGARWCRAAVIMPLMAPKASQAFPRPQQIVSPLPSPGRVDSVPRESPMRRLRMHAHGLSSHTLRGARVCRRCRAATRRRAFSARACGAAWTGGSRTSSGLRQTDSHCLPSLGSPLVAVQVSRGATARTECRVRGKSF